MIPHHETSAFYTSKKQRISLDRYKCFIIRVPSSLRRSDEFPVRPRPSIITQDKTFKKNSTHVAKKFTDVFDKAGTARGMGHTWCSGQVRCAEKNLVHLYGMEFPTCSTFLKLRVAILPHRKTVASPSSSSTVESLAMWQQPLLTCSKTCTSPNS